MGESASELRRDIEGIRSDLDRDLNALGDRVSPRRVYERRTRSMRRGLHAVKEAVMGPTEHALAGIDDGTHRMGDAASGFVDHAADVPDMVTSGTRGNPLAAGFLAFGVGLLLGSLVPATEPEQQMADRVAEQLEPIRHKAVESAQQLGEKMKSATGEATRTLQDDAHSAAREVRSQAQESAQEVRREVSGQQPS